MEAVTDAVESDKITTLGKREMLDEKSDKSSPKRQCWCEQGDSKKQMWVYKEMGFCDPSRTCTGQAHLGGILSKDLNDNILK